MNLRDPQHLNTEVSTKNRVSVTKYTDFVNTADMGKLTLEEFINTKLDPGTYILTLEKTDL